MINNEYHVYAATMILQQGTVTAGNRQGRLTLKYKPGRDRFD